MLVFSTKIPLKAETTRAQWVALFKEWVVNSDWYDIHESDFEGFDCAGHDPIEIVKGNCVFSITYYKDENVTLAACRLETRNSDDIWITQNVAYEENGRKYLLVQSHCIKKEYIDVLRKPATPYTVKLFIRNNMCDFDGAFPIIDKPITMSEELIEPCAQAMQGVGEGIMPIVYVSSYYWPTELDVKSLARALQGIAHVIVEPDQAISKMLREASNGYNVYGGYIGVYFPGHSYRRRFADQYYPNGTINDRMSTDIVDTIRNALLNTADATKYSWEHIKSLQHNQKVSKLQVATATLEDLREWYQTFNEENERLSNELSESKSTITKLYEENQRLAAILEGYHTSSGSQKAALLQTGKERDLYPGEQNDLLLDILTASLRTMGEDTRPYHVVQSILASNKANGTGIQIEDTIKKVFKGKGNIISEENIRTLSHIGFHVDKGKNHISLVFANDNRYQFTTASTPGDHRAGNNMNSTIRKKLFLRCKEV